MFLNLLRLKLLRFVCFGAVTFTTKLVIPFQMSNITVTYRDGRVAQLEQVYIRGSKIRFLILPDMLKNAPMLKSMKNKNQGSGAGRGKAAILKAQGRCFWGWLQNPYPLPFREKPYTHDNIPHPDLLPGLRNP